MVDAGVGRAIHPGSAPSPAPPTEFSPKAERTEGAIASKLIALGIKDIRVASSSAERILYSRDQSEIPRFLREIMFSSVPDAVVLAKSAEAVSAVVRFASSNGVTVVPRGSGSSPFGGSVPVSGGIVIDVSGMDRILSIDVPAKEVRVEAGVRWADLDHELEKHGLSLNTSPSSKFSTVAGWISTGGMGLNSFSKGHLSSMVSSIELVTSDGSKRTIKSNDPLFPAVFGSEGQLGVITGVTLSAREIPRKPKPHLIFFDESEGALSFAYALASSPVHPAHIVYESAAKFSLINRALGQNRFPASDAVIVSVENEESEHLFQAHLKSTGVKEEKEYLARYLWNERYFPMKVRKFGPGMLGSEVTVPLNLLSDVLAKAVDLCRDLGLEPLFEVHFLSDGHGLLLCYYVTDQGNTIGYTLDALKSMLLTSTLIDSGAKPYSIGIWNHPFSNAEEQARVDRLRKAKAALDPNDVMNSGKYFSLSGRFGGLASTAFNPKLMRPVLKAMRILSPITMR
ncbi:MAG: FAD-binding oxidoreductase, partial [Candidatus Thermoplasmatota archaeon]|nr:FAD-binding oxidoreductase [Candidatus Thermoplasmatota archaeon]